MAFSNRKVAPAVLLPVNEPSRLPSRPDHVLAAVVVTAVLSMALYFLVTVVERLVAPWGRSDREGAGRRG